jgi:transcription termination factor Rho
MERSALERKDRGELITIATAMGGKPGSRAKKADIVDLILELAGVPAHGPSGAGNTADASAGGPGPAEAPDPAAAPSATSDAPAPDATRAAAAPPERGLRPAPARAERPAAERTPTADRERTEVDRDRSEGTRAAGADRDRPGGDDATGADRDRADGDRATGTDRDRPGAEGRGEAEAAEAGEAGETGNRRRRRRGRDRDRPREDEVALAEPVPVDGLLDLRDDGYGFLRVAGYLPSKDDVYVSVKQVRQFGLREGDRIVGASRPAARTEKNPALLRIDSVNGREPDESIERPRFEDLTPLFPDERLRLELPDDPANMTARIIDLIAPIGKGQRGLIVSPPKAGKTSIMKQIVRSIERNHPEVHLIVLLVDERPEEVTDMRRWMLRGEVAASTFDRPSEEHVAVAELTIERAKRMVEEGSDVVVVLDGITRLARAHNLAAPGTGRIMSGGVDSGALYPPKKFFGAARNLEEGGSLTILATALVETGSRMDDVIFEEFKGTGNMELRLDRRLAERRIFPAIDVDASSTRHEELLFDRAQLQQVWKLRRVLSGLAADGGHPGAGLELLIDRMRTFRSNAEFLAEIAKAPSGI